ncbi:MAG: chemotaxis protein CheW [Terracidiphilus sp.]|jgi:purine-binding chemotaxis protein CheW
MTTKSKQHSNGTALLEESIPDGRAPDTQPEGAGDDENPIVERASAAQPDGAGVDENQSGERTSTAQQGTQQFVTFIAGDEVFAADMVPVKEIIRVPQVVRVPLAPAALEGLANLRGKVLPIISLRRLFGFPELPHDDSTRALVVDVGQPLGFVVDRVSSVVGVDASHIEDVGSIKTTVNTEMLSSLIKDVGGHAMIMVLDFAKVIEREFSQIAAISKNTGVAGAAQANLQNEEEDSSDELQLVSFDVDGQEYAIAIEDVQEIVQVPEAVIHVPRSESHVLGVMTLRSRLLPLVNLRSMFALPHRDLDEKSRIVVLTLGGVSVGVVVDAVSEVLRVSKSGVDALPAMLAREGNLAEVTSICRLDNGKRLVSIVTARNLFGHSVIKEALSAVNESELDSDREDTKQGDNLDDDEQVVIFRLDKEEFGAPIASVQEIVRVPEQLIRVPKAPSFVEGVINLRGTVLPVIDLRLRLGLKQVERTDRQRIMVFLISDVRTGFIVDQVAEVLRIPKAAIEPAPQLSAEQGLLLSRMANLEKQKRMVQLLDPPYLMGKKELVALAAVTG